MPKRARTAVNPPLITHATHYYGCVQVSI